MNSAFSTMRTSNHKPRLALNIIAGDLFWCARTTGLLRKGKQLMIEAYEEPPISSLFGLLKVPADAGIPDLDVAIDSVWDISAGETVRKGNR